jgi:hypothetical protein
MTAAPLRLNPALPDDQKNGLFDSKVVEDFLGAPRTAILVIGIVSNAVTETNNDTGTIRPVIKFRHIEVVGPGHDHYGIAAEILLQAQGARTGAMMLPFEPGQDIPLAGAEEPEEGTA